ncbi:hypothetical protein AHF37_06059 [Paragonimus kellicotti]|nr:hypothetical protein AHF37_06059 [Paragonimus kellicotti]
MDGITYLDTNADGFYFLSNSKDQTVRLWDLRKHTKPGTERVRVIVPFCVHSISFCLLPLTHPCLIHYFLFNMWRFYCWLLCVCLVLTMRYTTLVTVCELQSVSFGTAYV